MADVILDRVDYTKLDDPRSPVRIRLNSTAVQVKHLGETPVGRLRTDDRETEVTYVREDRLYRVGSKGAILACDNSVIPYICPELPEDQREALLLADRAVNMMTTVLVRTWTSFERLGISGVDSPGMFLQHLQSPYAETLRHIPAGTRPCGPRPGRIAEPVRRSAPPNHGSGAVRRQSTRTRHSAPGATCGASDPRVENPVRGLRASDPGAACASPFARWL